MAMRPHRPAQKQPLKLRPEMQQDGLFTGTAQAGAARPRRAHALAEELLARGCLYIQKQVWDEAGREFRKALQMEEDYAEAYNNLGLCLLYMGKASEAVQNLQLALHYFPGWHIAEANLGLALTRLNRNEEAIPYLEKAIAQKVQAPICLTLGDALAALGRIDKAIAAYQNALTVAPKSALAHYRIGMLQARRNNIDDAEAALLKAVPVRPRQRRGAGGAGSHRGAPRPPQPGRGLLRQGQGAAEGSRARAARPSSAGGVPQGPRQGFRRVEGADAHAPAARHLLLRPRPGASDRQ
ncbi:MAG: tetratricopeptide repeat protein [Planctomycetota bacterium]|nr:tetratricopeptide repeat protein [Planctomycetota bacterium]